MKTHRVSVRLEYVGIACCLLTAICFPAMAGPPGWWKNRTVIDPNLAPLDRGVALQGQAKHVTWQAYLELEEKLAPLGGAGSEISKMVRSDWFQDTSKDHLACQISQLKTLSAPFHDRLREFGISSGVSERYPWGKGEERDTAVAAIGQLKMVFSFDFDQDNDGLADWWESRTFATLAHSGTDDVDGDGIANRDEFRNGTAGHLADSDRDGVLDGLDTRPSHFDRPGPVTRRGPLELSGTRLVPAGKIFEEENKARVANGLKPLASMRRDEVRPPIEKPGEKGSSRFRPTPGTPTPGTPTPGTPTPGTPPSGERPDVFEPEAPDVEENR